MNSHTCFKSMIALFSSVFMLMSTALAADDNRTLHVYLQNLSGQTLTFKRVIGGNPGNTFSIYPRVIKSGDETIITVEKLMNNDISGRVIFTDPDGHEAPLLIIDQEQVHMGQPVFSVSNDYFSSQLTSSTRNRNVGPRFLTYVEARLKVFDR